MKIQYCSDLHLEFPQNRAFLHENPLARGGDVLLIAGDTYHLDKDYRHLEFIQKAADNFEAVYLIPGNHEYYGGYEFETAGQSWQQEIFSNVFMVNNQVISLDGVSLILSTLWSKIQHERYFIKRGMADFHRIKSHGKLIEIDQYNHAHQLCLEFLTKAVKIEGPKIVMSHHLPTNQANAPEFKNSLLSEAFVANLDPLIDESDINAWIYGHSHRNVGDFMINKTQMLSNQFGYVQLEEHHSFDRINSLTFK